jgi:hypothetical protein
MEYYERQIVWMVENGYTHREVSQYLQQILPFERGLSARSVRRFCAARGVSYRSQVDTPTLDRLIYECVLNVGHTYGRRTLHGLLRSEGINVSQRRIGSSLRTVFPEAHANRSMTLQRHINPIPYSAYYFGEKLHFDQNEKLNMFGVIHVLAIDGYSRKIVGFISIPSKNPILIYHHLYQPILSQYGVWDQLRMDHGTEFNLIISVHRSINCIVITIVNECAKAAKRKPLNTKSVISFCIVCTMLPHRTFADLRFSDLRFLISHFHIYTFAKKFNTTKG